LLTRTLVEQNLTKFINDDKIFEKLNIITEVCLGFRLIYNLLY